MLCHDHPTVYELYSSSLGGAPNANGDSMTTRVAVDHHMHQDFQPTSKSSDMSFSHIIALDVKEHPVVIYMKGYPDAPRCGFIALGVKVVHQYGNLSISAAYFKCKLRWYRLQAHLFKQQLPMFK
ncbi:hypothetical protein ZEAMMB73_Zm00001d025121, partial [Zea mays]